MNKVIKKINTNIYNISIIDNEITFLDKENKKLLIEPKIENSKFIASVITKYQNNFSVKFACLQEEICNPIIYIFLLPFVTINNYYIIKVGYTKDIITRYINLKKEFGVNEIYLMYAYQINGEHIELNLHDELKNYFQQMYIKCLKKLINQGLKKHISSH